MVVTSGLEPVPLGLQPSALPSKLRNLGAPGGTFPHICLPIGGILVIGRRAHDRPTRLPNLGDLAVLGSSTPGRA